MPANQPLDCTVENDELVIRIGIDVLAFAFDESDGNNPWSDELSDFERLSQIENPLQFAKDVACELEDEREDGSTILTDLLDKACEQAAENGSLGLGGS
jgi:hypothetical protein